MSDNEYRVQTFLLVKIGENNDVDEVCRMIADIEDISSAVHKVLGHYDLLIECSGDTKHIKEKIVNPLTERQNIVHSLVDINSLGLAYEFIESPKPE